MWESADCVTFNRSAAAVTLPRRSTSMTIERYWRSNIACLHSSNAFATSRATPRLVHHFAYCDKLVLRDVSANAAKPSTGPGTRSQVASSPTCSNRVVVAAIDTTVIAKPIEFCIASALPTRTGGQALAASAENCGESATTEAPHTMSVTTMTPGERWRQPRAKVSPHSPDIASAPTATRALPMRPDRTPPIREPNAPMPITTNDMPETVTPGKCTVSDVRATSNGTAVQNVYSSHM